jgi:hypothetical protein
VKGEPLPGVLATQPPSTGLEAPHECLEPSSFDRLIRGVEVHLRLKAGRKQKRDNEMAAMADEVPAAGEMVFES